MYAELSDIQARFPHLTFDATSAPSQANVERYIDAIDGIINGILDGGGFSVPVVDPMHVTYLRAGAAAGAASLLFDSLHDSNPEATAANPWQEPWEAFRDRLRTHGLPGATRNASIELPSFFYT